MRVFRDRVAVVTGAASGIGRGLAERCAKEGMKVVLADIEAEPLQLVETELRGAGAEVLSLITDVADPDAVRELAATTLDRFGGVHLLFNNAGVGAGGKAWECTVKDWEWTLGVNLWGTIHAINTFVPIMLAQENACHIVNTASIEGLWARPGHAPYQVSKHGIVCLSEVLYQDLKFDGAKIGVSVLCPGAVDTNIVDSWRNRPEHLRNQLPPNYQPNKEMLARAQELRNSFKTGMTRTECAALVFDAIRSESLYVITHKELKGYVRDRMNNILDEHNPDLDKVPMKPAPKIA